MNDAPTTDRAPLPLRLRGLTVAPAGSGRRAPPVVLRDVDLDIDAGCMTTLVGPSGAGKTTLLRAVAGLAEVRSGQVLLGDTDLAGVAVRHRGIGVVFQQPRLFPNLDVAENVAFGLRAAGVDADTRRAAAVDLLEQVGLAGFASRRVRGLSGGEQQRVNLARALAIRPALLLFDEPLAAVDPERRTELRRLVERVQREARTTALYVTHDREEAAELGDHVAVLLDGRVVQHGPPPELFERPSTAFVARFFGAENVLDGTVVDGRMSWGDGHLPVSGPDGPATVVVRPEHLDVVAPSDGHLGAVVESTAYLGSHVRVALHTLSGGLVATASTARPPAVGAGVGVRVHAGRVWRLPVAGPTATRTPSLEERADR